MLKYFYMQNIRVPAYGLFVVMGIVLCGCIALQIAKRRQHKPSIVLLLGTIGGIGAVVGAKLLTLFTSSVREGVILLSWNNFQEAGYSYYGGLFVFFVFIWISCGLIKNKKEKLYWPVGMYLVMYGTTRFAIEFLRYHREGVFISDGQICSVISVMVGVVAISIKKKQAGINR